MHSMCIRDRAPWVRTPLSSPEQEDDTPASRIFHLSEARASSSPLHTASPLSGPGLTTGLFKKQRYMRLSVFCHEAIAADSSCAAKHLGCSAGSSGHINPLRPFLYNELKKRKKDSERKCMCFGENHPYCDGDNRPVCRGHCREWNPNLPSLRG